MGINKVELATGETLIDLSGDTVTPDLLAEGATAHDANGDPVPGTFPISEVDTQADLINQIKATLNGKAAPSGGESVEKLEIIDATFDLATMSISNMSHTHAQIKELINNGKTVVFRSNAGVAYTFGSLVFYNLDTDRIGFQIMIQDDFGQGYMLYYFNVVVYSDDRINVTPYVVNLIGMGG